MVYSNQYQDFRQDKNQFFGQLRSVSKHADDSNMDAKIQIADDRANHIGYTFLLNNQKALEDEFTQMFAVLQKQKDENNEAFWLYCYYCASLLEAFYKAYSQESNEKKYRDLKKQIKGYLQNEEQNTEAEKHFIESLKEDFSKGITNLIKSPFHTSKLRDYVAFSNLCRLYWVFCRLTLTNALSLARDLQFIEKLDAILGTHIDVDKIISAFQAPTGVLYYFSVGLFLARFMIDAGTLLKHTLIEKSGGCRAQLVSDDPDEIDKKDVINKRKILFINNGEVFQICYCSINGEYVQNNIENPNLIDVLNKYQAEEVILNTEDLGEINAYLSSLGISTRVGNTTALDRFKFELYKRQCNFGNDLVWATVNFLTNFNQITNIPGPVAGAITAVFLGFDVCMALYRLSLAKQEYLAKKAQYSQEINDYNDHEQFPDMTDTQRLAHINMLNKQLIELEINWRTKEATFYFVAAAAVLLMLGFTAALIFSPPGIIIASYFMCTLAAAMYFSIDSYSKYKEKSLYLEQAELTGAGLAVALKEYQAARNDFIFIMAKNTIVPTLLIATYANCYLCYLLACCSSFNGSLFRI